MQKLIELAQRIKDEKLRKKVIDFLEDMKLSSKDFEKYKHMPIEEARTLFTVGQPPITVERDILNHTLALADVCLRVADIIEKNYGISINKDDLLAAAILHDLPHLFEYKRGESGLEHTGIMLDHTMLGVAEYYHRNFPESVIHIIASHAGEHGTTPPRNFEALIFHYCDTLLSLVEFHLYSQKQQQVQVVLLDEDMLKKITGENTEKKHG
jgi:7,8-dihydroneopterin 2',3'-cyclic phosphate phosphodiesterase